MYERTGHMHAVVGIKAREQLLGAGPLLPSTGVPGLSCSHTLGDSCHLVGLVFVFSSAGNRFSCAAGLWSFAMAQG